ncbi:hypothetical protein SAMN05444141_101965 [Pseudovibrio denitrificans]|uniref:Uncharacterized protein n=1 Tax=Pseudovibrio denitrificans TaxID=258256 RepID=A0A1I6YLB4_9HYPH|nr:hypothetical protein SAMN05444141_101965 [Pseudovibrio denitrificans]
MLTLEYQWDENTEGLYVVGNAKNAKNLAIWLFNQICAHSMSGQTSEGQMLGSGGINPV